eukprot:scaffold227111_cov17-Prasinocladus_malaysianus.AAC.1
MRPTSFSRMANDSVVLPHCLHTYTDGSAACRDCMNSDKRSTDHGAIILTKTIVESTDAFKRS